MKGFVRPKYILIFLPLFIAAIVLTQIVKPQTTPNPVSLQARASQSGNYVSYAQPNIYPKLADLNQLTLASTDIITGTAGTNVCRLSVDGTFVTTDFQVTVQSVLRGNLPVGSNITVSLPGGRVAFANPCVGIGCVNPTTAEIRVPWFKKMTEGNRYYIFLVGSKNPVTGQSLTTYKPTAGPQGVFQIINGTVKSNSGRLRDPMWQYNNMSDGLFKGRIEEANRAAPLPNPSPQVPQS